MLEFSSGRAPKVCLTCLANVFYVCGQEDLTRPGDLYRTWMLNQRFYCNRRVCLPAANTRKPPPFSPRGTYQILSTCLDRPTRKG